MSSHQEITHLINRYGFAIDTGDLDGFANLFEYGEWGLEGVALLVGSAKLRKAISNVIIYEDGTPRTRHLTTNIDLEIDEAADTAKGQCYVTVYQQTDDFPLQVIFSGHYFDRFERVDKTWRFKRRIVKHQLVGDMSVHLESAEKLISGE